MAKTVNDYYGGNGYALPTLAEWAEHGAAGDVDTGRRLKYVQDVPLKQIIDAASATATYIGETLPGTATSSALWRIKKIDETSNPTTILFADGNDKFDNVWDNRASLSYS